MKVIWPGRLTAKNKGGEIACADGILSVEKADEAIIYVSIATNFYNYQDITGNQILSVEINVIPLRFNERMNHCLCQIVFCPFYLITGDVLIVVEISCKCDNR